MSGKNSKDLGEVLRLIVCCSGAETASRTVAGNGFKGERNWIRAQRSATEFNHPIRNDHALNVPFNAFTLGLRKKPKPLTITGLGKVSENLEEQKQSLGAKNTGSQSGEIRTRDH